MKRPRKHLSLAVKLNAALNALGLLGKAVAYDHRPPLSHRPRNADDTDYDPAELDPRYIYPVTKEENEALNRGTHVPLSGDTSVAAKLKRLETKFRTRCVKIDGTPIESYKPKRAWPKRKFPKRAKR